MSDSPWFKLYPSDWLAGTGDLTAAERGVYITIVCLIYEYGGPVPLDRARLARRCGLPAGSFKRVLDALIEVGKLIQTDAGITNSRAERELGDREKLRTKQQSGARKSNAIQAEKKQQKQQEDERTAQRSEDAYQKPEPDKKDKTNVLSKKNGSRIADDWELPSDWFDWAISEGWPEDGIRDEAEKFKDFWLGKSGKDGVKADWLATWRNWMRNSPCQKTSGGGTGQIDRAKISDALERARRHVESYPPGSALHEAGKKTIAHWEETA